MTMTLHLGQGESLKAKRKVVRSIGDRVRARFNAAAAEVGGQDLWQRIELGFAVCGNETAHVDSQLDSIRRFVERLALAEVVDVRRELINLKEMTWAPAAQSDWAT
ncbi:MAG: DUF503 domain-containing protein [Desulfarculus sp.]|jgi:uncharacterized protein YlxP (DUF503 family)|nr:MAG: DUF503 domain-containing protein [Desulfarculus sp.]